MSVKRTPPLQDGMFRRSGQIRVELKGKRGTGKPPGRTEIEALDRLADTGFSFDEQVKEVENYSHEVLEKSGLYSALTTAGWSRNEATTFWENGQYKFVILPPEFTKDFPPGSVEWFAAEVLNALTLARLFKRLGNIDSFAVQVLQVGRLLTEIALIPVWNPHAKRGLKTRASASKGGRERAKSFNQETEKKRRQNAYEKFKNDTTSHYAACILAARSLGLKSWKSIDRLVERRP